jgi:hypothetical protein
MRPGWVRVVLKRDIAGTDDSFRLLIEPNGIRVFSIRQI